MPLPTLTFALLVLTAQHLPGRFGQRPQRYDLFTFLVHFDPTSKLTLDT